MISKTLEELLSEINETYDGYEGSMAVQTMNNLPSVGSVGAISEGKGENTTKYKTSEPTYDPTEPTKLPLTEVELHIEPTKPTEVLSNIKAEDWEKLLISAYYNGLQAEFYTLKNTYKILECFLQMQPDNRKFVEKVFDYMERFQPRLNSLLLEIRELREANDFFDINI